MKVCLMCTTIVPYMLIYMIISYRCQDSLVMARGVEALTSERRRLCEIVILVAAAQGHGQRLQQATTRHAHGGTWGAAEGKTQQAPPWS